MARAGRSKPWVRIGSLVGLLIVAPFLLYAAVRLYGAYMDQKAAGNREICLDNLRVIGTLLRSYALDHDDRLPPADRWQDVLLADTGDPRVFQCPAAPKGTRSGYAYFADLSSGSLDNLISPADVPMVYDSAKGTWNARDSYPELPSPPRHDGRNHALMADGSVQRLAPFDVWVGARFQDDGEGGPGEVKTLPGHTGPSVLFQAEEPIAFRTEHGIEWTARELPDGCLFVGPAESEILTRIRWPGEGEGLPPLPPTATIEDRYPIAMAPDPGQYSVIGEAMEYVDGDVRVLRIELPMDPAMVATVRVPAAAGEEQLGEACLPLTALRRVETSGP